MAPSPRSLLWPCVIAAGLAMLMEPRPVESADVQWQLDQAHPDASIPVEIDELRRAPTVVMVPVQEVVNPTTSGISIQGTLEITAPDKNAPARAFPLGTFTILAASQAGQYLLPVSPSMSAIIEELANHHQARLVLSMRLLSPVSSDGDVRVRIGEPKWIHVEAG